MSAVKVLRRIFGPKRHQRQRNGVQLHNEKHHNL